MTKSINEAPLAKGLPILGSALSLGNNTRAFLYDQYQKLGPVFRVNALNRKLVVLAGLEANQFVIRHGHNLFRSYEFWKDLNTELGANQSILSMDGDDHRHFRKVQKTGYARSVILKQIPEVIELAQREIKTWKVGQVYPGLFSLQRIITEQLGYLAASFSPHEYLDDMISFVRTLLLTKVMKTHPNIYTKLPSYQRVKARALKLGQEVAKAHQTPPEENNRRRDLADDILQLAKDEPDFLPQEDIMGSLLGPFIAGLDTAASTTAFMLYVLLKEQKLYNQVKKEVDRVWASDITPEAIRELDLLHRTALETMRMYPIAPALNRTVNQPFEFNGYQFTEGTTIILGTTVPHYVPEIYPNPNQFDIDRYTAARKEHKTLGAYAPFGIGPHTCLGAGLAEVQIMLTIGTILHTVDLELYPANYTLKINPTPTPSPDKNFKFLVTG